MEEEGKDVASLQSGLASVRMKRWMNEIAKARACGVGDRIPLPQVVVCGDQSVGKSSVLEGITSIPFPRKEGLCTRFATEIILRHAPQKHTSIIASVIPHAARDDSTRESLRTYTHSLSGYEELAEVIEEVSKLMGLRSYTDHDDDAPAFVADILRIEVTGPGSLNLSVVDLPGLIEGSGDKDAVDLVSSLVDGYLKESRTIILAVFPAASDIETQPIMRHVRSLDKTGKRTVGVITKADLINEGSQDRIAALMQNRGPIKLDLGFFLLKNPDPKQISSGISPERRQKDEEEYFRKAQWQIEGIESTRTGVTNLRAYCISLMERHVERELPGMRRDVRNLLEESQMKLIALGEERDTLPNQRVYLSNLSIEFYELVRSSVDGRYNDSPFFDPETGHPMQNRLRALVHCLNGRLSDFMRENSHKFKINEARERTKSSIAEEDDYYECGSFDTLGKPEKVSSKQFNDWIMRVYKKTRGLELSGSYNSAFLSELFHEQSSRWPEIARTHVMMVHSSAAALLDRILIHVIKEEGLRLHIQDIVDTSSQMILRNALDELAKIGEDEKFQPITYNHYYTDNIQKHRNTSTKREMKAAVDEIMESWGNSFVRNTFEEKAELLESLQKRVQVDMDLQTCEEASAALSSYYKVAMKKFVDNVCCQVVERHIMRKLPSIFGPSMVARMSDEEISRIAMEPEKNTKHRKRLRELIDALQRCLDQLRI